MTTIFLGLVVESTNETAQFKESPSASFTIISSDGGEKPSDIKTGKTV